MDSQTTRSIDKRIAIFLAKHKPDDVSKWEEEHNYVWVSMIPFVSLAFSGPLVKNNPLPESDGNEEQCEDKNQCQATSNVIYNDVDDPNLLPEKPLFMEKKKDNLVSHCFGDENTDIKKQFPETGNPDSAASGSCGYHSLSVATEDRPRMMLGSKQTRKLGLFALQHMLNSSGNRQLVENERLLSLLYCLCWHIDDGVQLKAQLRKHWTPSPASLSVICKSSLAFVFGLETALTM